MVLCRVLCPPLIREKLGFKQFLKVVLEVEKKKKAIRVRPVSDILDLAGEFKPKKKESVLRAREEMERSYQRAWLF